jgi:MoxR-like ATPase
MTVREALLSEIDRAPDEVLNVLLSILRITHGQSQNQGLETVVRT